jgi:hypothetical protein
VTAAFHEEGSVLKGNKRGSCDGFEIEVSLESDEPTEKVREMIRLAHAMCFTEAALTQANRIEFKHRLNGEEIG